MVCIVKLEDLLKIVESPCYKTKWRKLKKSLLLVYGGWLSNQDMIALLGYSPRSLSDTRVHHGVFPTSNPWDDKYPKTDPKVMTCACIMYVTDRLSLEEVLVRFDVDADEIISITRGVL